ncbi:diguanylate cyclase [Aliikangiella sp. IMCC44653]
MKEKTIGGSKLWHLFAVISLLVPFNVASQTEWSSQFKPFISVLFDHPLQLQQSLDNNKDQWLSPHEQSQYHLLKSLAYIELVRPKLAYEQSLLALSTITQSGNPWLYHKIKLAQAQALDLGGESIKALPQINEALNFAKTNQLTPLQIEALIVRGLTLNTLLRSGEALEDLQQAYLLAPVAKALFTKAVVAGYIALVYEYRREPMESLPYFNEALTYYQLIGAKQQLSDIYYGKGRALIAINEKSDGVELLLLSAQLSESIGDQQGAAYSYKEIAASFASEKRYPEALAMYKKAEKIFIKAQNPFMQASTKLAEASILIRQNQASEAIEILKQTKQEIKPDSMQSYEERIEELLASAYASKNQFEKAYQSLLSANKIRNKYQSRMNSKNIEKLKAEFELSKKEAEFLLLQKTNKIQALELAAEIKKNHSMILVMSLSIIIALLLGLILHRAKASKKKFELLAEKDDLTGAFNRRKTMQLLDYHMQLEHRHTYELCVAMIDLDFFKNVNDNYGHHIGDQVLVEFTKLCHKLFRKTDIIGRIGGEEFIIALPYTNLPCAEKLLENLRYLVTQISQHEEFEGIPLSVSIGLTEYKPKEDIQTLLNKADKALYVAKQNGRNQVVTFKQDDKDFMPPKHTEEAAQA